MIFVTVGTHEQQFNRLIKKMDQLKEDGKIKDEVFIQTGFSDYVPENCSWKKFLSYEEMIQKIKDAKIVITHGGPSSFIIPIQYGKTPIVIPRMRKYGEHVNDHQVDFCKKYNSLYKNIIIVENMEELSLKLLSVIRKKTLVESDSNTTNFCNKLSNVVKEILK